MLRKFRILSALTLVFGALGFAAQGCTVSAAIGDSCSADSDCDGACSAGNVPGTDICLTGVCTCSLGTVDCTADTDCADGEACVDGFCEVDTGCTDDSECAALCDGAVCADDGTCDISMCTTGGCTDDTECPCDDGTDDGVCASDGTCDLSSCPSGGPDCTCACTNTLAMSGCEDVCTMGDNGTTTPNFCDGVAALPQCATCLEGACGFAAADAADPTTCN